MKQLNSLRLDVFREKPALRKLVDEYGQMTLFEYAASNYRIQKNENTIALARKKEFLDFFKAYTAKLFDTNVNEKIIDSLEQNYCISTADHHGPIGHPFFFQSTILRGLIQPKHALVHFCTSQVSLGNSSYPRGLIFHGDGNNAPNTYLTLPFFPSRDRMCPVYKHNALEEKNIFDTTLPRIREYREKGFISHEQEDNIEKFLKDFLLKHVSQWQTYSEQISALNHAWWEKLFPSILPPLVHIDAEDIVKEIIIKKFSEKGPLYDILYDMTIVSEVENAFNGISCCFDTATKHGTYLFWYLDGDKTRHALWRNGSFLCDSTGTYQISLSRDTINQYLKDGKLIPSGLLIYAILDCYYGLTCFGGFSQGTYLKQIQEGYKKLNKDIFCSGNKADILCEDMIFCFLEKNKILTALDITLAKKEISHEYYIEQAKNMTICSSIDAMLPEIARCIKI